MIIKVILPFIFCSSWIKDRLKQKFPSANTLRPSLQFNPSAQVRLVSILPLTEWSSGSNLPGKFWSLEYRDLNPSDCLCSDRLHTIIVHCISACVLSVLHVFHQPLRALSTDLRQVSAIHFLALSFEYSDRFTKLSSPKRKIKKTQTKSSWWHNSDVLSSSMEKLPLPHWLQQECRKWHSWWKGASANTVLLLA